MRLAYRFRPMLHAKVIGSALRCCTARLHRARTPIAPCDGLTSAHASVCYGLCFSGLSNDVEVLSPVVRLQRHDRCNHQPARGGDSPSSFGKAKLRQLQDKRDSQSSLAPLLSIDWVASGIRDIAADKTIKPNVRLAAFIAAGKLRGVNAFGSDPIEQPQQRSVDDIDKQLLAMLRGMVSTIDGDARDVTPAKEKAPAVKPGPAVVGRKRKPRGG
jgi:hypothetical protein